VKRRTKKASTPQVVCFRPSPFTRDLLDEISAKWGQSPGESARRLVALQLHRLDADFHGDISELSELQYTGADFEKACETVSAHCLEQNIGYAAADRDRRVQAVKELILHLRLARGVTEESREKIRIHLIRGNT
jgi:hypothetical protein